MTDTTATTHSAHRTCHHLTFFMTCEEFEALLLRSQNCCEICGRTADETPRRVLCIDHDHRYGPAAVRGLLCDRCNWDVGAVESRQYGITPNIREYFANAWFMDVEEIRRRRNPLLRCPHPDWRRWIEFRRAARRQGTLVLRQFIDWYLSTPGAEMPVRPDASAK